MRSTQTDVISDRFQVPNLADGSYTVVINAEGAATAVISGVPVAAAAGTTRLNTSASPIPPCERNA